MWQKYKVFLNDRMIIIDTPDGASENKFVVKFKSKITKEDVSVWFQSFINSHPDEVILLHPAPEEFFKLFKSIFVEIPAAGGVVLSEEKILFIFRNGKWDLPKGKIEIGETAVQAALREVSEECGISGHRILKQLPPTYHIYISPYKKTKGAWIFKETRWFEMNYPGNFAGKPEKNEGITKIEWLPKNELNKILENTYKNLEQIIKNYCD